MPQAKTESTQNTAVVICEPAILRPTELCKYLSVSKTKLISLGRDPKSKFPKPLKLGASGTKAVGWLKTEIDAWLRSQPRCNA